MNYRNAVFGRGEKVPSQKEVVMVEKPRIVWQKEVVMVEEPRIVWHKEDMRSMQSAQKELNEFIIQASSNITESTKSKIRALQRDIDEYYTSTCSVCGDKQSNNTHMNIEHVKMKVSWGYESDYDGQTHQLVLCCKCYTQHIMKSHLGKFVQKKNYM